MTDDTVALGAMTLDPVGPDVQGDPILRLFASIAEQASFDLGITVAVDGALVLNKQFEVVGFGVELRAPALPTTCVYRALDPEATQLQAEAANSGGPRHRAAYRLCQAEPECLERNGLVERWDGHLAPGMYNASQCMYHINARIGADMPIAETIYKMLWERLLPEEGFKQIEKELV